MVQPHAAIIRCLSAQPMSLADLAAAAQVSLPTLQRAVKDLTESGWVRAAGRAATTGGRPAVLYGLDASTHLIIGVHLQLPGVRLAAVTLAGDVLDKRQIENGVATSPDEVVREIAAYVEQVARRYPARTLLGIGLAAPGFIDMASGEILAIGRVASWQHFPIKARLVAALGLPVIVENDVDSMAVAELQQGRIPTGQNLIYLGFTEGFKASLFLDGQRYSGPFGNAGNIGSTVLFCGQPADGSAPRQAQKIVSVRAVCQAFDERVGDAPTSNPMHAAIQSAGDLAAKFQRILEAAEAGDSLCASLAADMIALLAVVVANLLNTIQPNLLIIGGALSDLPPRLFNQFETAIRGYLPQPIANYVLIQRARLSSPNLVIAGIAREFLEQYVAQEDFFQLEGATG